MPIGRNWAEELVAEWLTLDGFLVYIGMPVGSGGRGGLKDADAVGVKADSGGLNINHVEVGQLWRKGGTNANIHHVLSKFNQNTVQVIQTYMMNSFGVYQVSNYTKTYVATYCPKNAVHTMRAQLTNHNINFLTMPDLINVLKNLLGTFRPPYRSTSNVHTCPESLWMIKLLECMKWWQII